MIVNEDIKARIAMCDEAIADGSPFVTQLMQLRASLVKKLPEAPETSAQMEEAHSPSKRSNGQQASTRAARSATEKQISFLTKLVATRELGMVKPPADLSTLGSKAASAMIDDLLGHDLVATSTPVSAASDKQISFINRLAAERETSPFTPEDIETIINKGSRDAIRVLINGLVAAPYRVQQNPQSDAPELGMYRTADGTIYKVYKTVHGARKMCAKELVIEADGDARFEYRGLATRYVTPEQKMTLAQAKEFGAIYGVCCVCSATLTDENSIEAGIGPVCARKF